MASTSTIINNCLLCLKYSENLINILNEESFKPTISQILSKHFWFEAEQNIYSNFICTTCWSIVENFHKFYEATLEVHKAYYSQIPGVEATLENQEKCTLNDVEIKIENLENLPVSDEVVKSENDLEDISTFEEHTTDDEDVDETFVEQSNDESESEKEIKIKTRKKKQKSTRPNEAKLRKGKSAEDLAKIEKEDEEIRIHYIMECELCDTKFDKFLNAKSHYRTKHSIPGYLRCCNKKIRKRCYALEHLQWHLNPNEFLCTVCNRTFVDKQGLQIHRVSHLPAEMKPFKCTKCPEIFAKMYQLRQHQAKHNTANLEKSFFCDDCGKAYGSSRLLQLHKRNVHEEAFKQVCEVCAKSFKRMAFYRVHMENVHGEKPRVQCNLCSAWLKNESSLRVHMARHADSRNTYICSICNKEAPNRNALQSHHKYVHENERTHKCNICSKAFKKAIALKEHMTTHTGGVLYTCPHCPKTFNSSANMHSHRKKMHTKEWEENRQNRAKVYNQNLTGDHIQ